MGRLYCVDFCCGDFFSRLLSKYTPVPMVKIWDAVQGAKRNLWPPPHEIPETHTQCKPAYTDAFGACSAHPMSVFSDTYIILRCVPSAHTGASEPWPEKYTDPSTLYLLWPGYSVQVNHRITEWSGVCVCVWDTEQSVNALNRCVCVCERVEVFASVNGVIVDECYQLFCYLQLDTCLNCSSCSGYETNTLTFKVNTVQNYKELTRSIRPK